MRAGICTMVWLLTAVAHAATLRVPLALELVEDRKTVVVGFQSGALATIDGKTGRVVQILERSGSITDLAALGEHRMLATDYSHRSLLLLGIESGRIEIRDELKMAGDPVSITVDPWSNRAFMGSKWSKSLTFIEVGEQIVEEAQLRLPFSPRALLLFQNGEKLLVADVHGGNLAVIDTRSRQIESLKTLAGHNIRGLALNPERDHVYVAHQRLNTLARTSFDDIHWGMLLTNVVREIPVAVLLGQNPSVTSASRIWNLGEVGQGAGDPAEIAVLGNGEILVTLAGTGHILSGHFGEPPSTVTETGARPSSLAVDEFGDRVYVANALDDLLSVLDLPSREIVATINLAPPNLMISAADRGARHFFNANLSHDGWFSCHSCHTNGHSNGQLSDTLGDGSYGTSKLVPSLLGMAETAPFGWLGNHPSLEAQIEATLNSTMQHRGANLTRDQIGDLAVFVASLPPPPRLPESNASNRGHRLFLEMNSARCHREKSLTRPELFDVGVINQSGNREFNPPSLIGVWHRSAFFHDGRFRDLKSVFQRGKHRLSRDLSEREIEDLVAYLGTL